ncbi:MAG: hypothetical protein QOE35_3386 [Actinomycetota bacterium]
MLAVEDEPDIAGLLGAFFRASGLGLEHVDPSGTAAVLEAIGEYAPRCVLLDLNLAGFSGLEVLEAIRAHPLHRNLPVLVVTADNRPVTRQRAEQLGATGFVAKPFSVSELFDQVMALAEATPAPAPAPRPRERAEVASSGDIQAELATVLGRAKRAGTPASFVLVRVGASEAAVLETLRDRLPDAVIGRSGPDEIAVILTGMNAGAAAAALARHLPECGDDVRAGVADAPTHATTPDQLYMAADAALAEAIERAAPVVAAR